MNCLQTRSDADWKMRIGTDKSAWLQSTAGLPVTRQECSKTLISRPALTHV
jgi:hypothetical protein